jgi:hypothetical protein
MTLKASADIEKRQAAAQARGVSEQTLIEQALEAFLTQEPRRNAKGFAIPSFVGSVASDDPSWIDDHANLLWNN